MSWGGLIGAVVGGVVGYFIGGPLGAAYGMAVGFSIGMIVDPMEADIESVGEPSRPADKMGVTPNNIGTPIYDLLGTGSIKGNLLFYGRERSEAIYSESSGGGKGGGGGDPPKQITGYEYYMSWGIGICIGEVDEFYSIWNDDVCEWSGNLTKPASGGQETIVVGNMGSATVSFGTQDQMPISSVSKMIPDSTLNTPYRGLCWVYFNDCYIGKTKRMPSMRFVIRKTPALSFNNNHLIQNHDYNPMHAIWYILHNLTGLPESWLNDTTFSDVADTLYGENRGISVLFGRQQKAMAYIENINAHIDGITLYKNDGEFHPKLIRDDYGSPSTTVDESVLLEEPTFNRGSWIDTINEIKVLYSELLGLDIYYQIQAAGASPAGLPRDATGDYKLSPADLRGYGYKIFGYSNVSFAIKDDGTLWAAGSYNYYGNLGTGDTDPRPYAYVPIGNDDDWESIDYGVCTLALKKDKTIWATGNNYHGSLGIPEVGTGSGKYITEFTQVAPGMLFPGTYFPISWKKISSGASHSLFLSLEGYVFWCGNGRGVGKSSSITQDSLEILSAHKCKDIYAVNNFSMLIHEDGTLWCAGINSSGQLGLGYTSGTLPFTLNTTGSQYEPWDKFALKGSFENALIIKENGTMWGCGANSAPGETYSQLGVGNNDVYTISLTQEATHSNDWTKAVTGSSALKSDRTLWSTGSNNAGQLGISDKVDRDVFTQVTEVSTEWTDVARSNITIHAVQYSYNVPANVFVDFRESTASPIAVDEGNIAIQDRTVTKAMKMALFTRNENAVWAGRTALQKLSYPYAQIKVTVNRNLFRLEVGDCFYFSYDPYSVSNMICRVMRIEEKDISSENITITAVEDVFGVTRARVDYTEPNDNTQQIPDTSINPFDNEKILESPYVLSETATELIPIAGRESLLDLGFYLYMSVDSGASYTLLDAFGSLMPHGTLVGTYSNDTYTIDNSDAGFTVDFDFTEDINQFETTTFSSVLASMSNTAILGDEIISVQTITPDVDNKYILTDVIRGRYGTEKEDHTQGTKFYFIHLDVMKVIHNEIIPNATRYFKFVPYNNVESGDIAECAAVGITITGKSKTPYKPTNFLANDGAYAARYSGDIVLTWSPRYRGKGAGIGAPGEVLADTDREGLFRIEVFVSDVNVRDITDVDAATYTYTEAMNISDNGSLANSITFKLYNFIETDGTTYECDSVEVTCKKSL